MSEPFANLPRNHFRAILADPPWRFATWSENGGGRSAGIHYPTMPLCEAACLHVDELAAADCVLFMWATWPMLHTGLQLIEDWGFEYKTCAFDWMKADVSTIDMFSAPKDASMKMGYWTRSNSEPCLLATRGKPKRRDAGVRMGIIEPSREHSRKPSCVYERIERLVEGPYLELFARNTRPRWTSWGLEVGKYGEVA